MAFNPLTNITLTIFLPDIMGDSHLPNPVHSTAARISLVAPSGAAMAISFVWVLLHDFFNISKRFII